MRTAQTRDRVALIWLAKDGGRRELTYASSRSRRTASRARLESLGVRAGDRVFTLLGRVPELHVAVLGALKLGAVVSPLVLGVRPRADPSADAPRRRPCARDVSVAVPAQGRSRARRSCPSSRTCCSSTARTPTSPGAHDLAALLAAADPEFAIPPTAPDQLALLHFTSGTTGTPKGAMHVHEAVVAHHATARLALDLRAGDVFWCTADPGWVTGTSYGIIAPLTIGATLVVDEAEFDAARWYETLARERVNVWYTAPTAVRMMMRAATVSARDHDLSALRFVSSVGEPLNPEAVLWGVDALGLAIHDNWWQTETGGIMIANFAACDIRPGSMGRPLPGIDATILRRDEHGDVVVRDGVAVEADVRRGGRARVAARVAVDVPRLPRRGGALPPVLRGRLVLQRRPRDPRRRRLVLVRRPGRRRHQVGRPSHRAVRGRERADGASGGRRGRRDRQARSGRRRGREGVRRAAGRLRADRRAAPRAHRLRPQAAGRRGGTEGDRVPTPTCPKTRSGKIMRRLLRARELGLPEGDLSTLESDS